MKIDLDQLQIARAVEHLGITPPPARGRKALPLSVHYVRDLDEEDILHLIQQPEGDMATPSIQQLKHSHHNLARLLAEGVSGAECSLITGYSPSRISILKHDPAFAELLVYYAEQQKEIFVNVHERLATVGLDALQELQRRLEEDGESFSTKELLDTLGVTMDRAGYGPKSTVTHNLGGGMAEILDIVKKEVDTRQDGKIKPLNPQTISSSYRRSDLGATADGEASDHSEGAAKGDEGSGSELREEGGSVSDKIITLGD